MNQPHTQPHNSHPSVPLKVFNSTFEDWIEAGDVMKLLKISENTLRKYIRQGILHYTPLNKRKLFYKPHILHALESRYR